MTCGLCHRIVYTGTICTLCAAAALGSSPMRDEHQDHGPEPPDPATFFVRAPPLASASSSQSTVARPYIYAGSLGTVTLRLPKS